MFHVNNTNSVFTSSQQCTIYKAHHLAFEENKNAWKSAVLYSFGVVCQQLKYLSGKQSDHSDVSHSHSDCESEMSVIL